LCGSAGSAIHYADAIRAYLRLRCADRGAIREIAPKAEESSAALGACVSQPSAAARHRSSLALAIEMLGTPRVEVGGGEISELLRVKTDLGK